MRPSRPPPPSDAVGARVPWKNADSIAALRTLQGKKHPTLLTVVVTQRAERDKLSAWVRTAAKPEDVSKNVNVDYATGFEPRTPMQSQAEMRSMRSDANTVVLATEDLQHFAARAHAARPTLQLEMTTHRNLHSGQVQIPGEAIPRPQGAHGIARDGHVHRPELLGIFHPHHRLISGD